MTVLRGWRRLGAGVCAAGVVLAGCGQSDPEGHVAGDRSPLAEFFGWEDSFGRGGNWEFREYTEEQRQQHHQVEELVAGCMQDAGFEYHPEPFWGDVDPDAQITDAMRERWELQQSDPEAFAKQYGYGITTIDEDLTVEEESDLSGDPNGAYRESLSEPAQEAYDEALHGDWESADENRGCRYQADVEVYGTEPGEWSPVWLEIHQLESRILNDPRLVEVAQRWSGCMASAGYPGLEGGLGVARREVSDRLHELYGYDIRPWEDSADIEEGDVDESEPVEPDPAELAALREFELDIAWADYECRQELDVDLVEREVRHEHEEQFIEDHRDLLEAYRDFLEETFG